MSNPITPASPFKCNHRDGGGEPDCAGEKLAGRTFSFGGGIVWLLWVSGDPKSTEDLGRMTECYFHKSSAARPLVEVARECGFPMEGEFPDLKPASKARAKGRDTGRKVEPPRTRSPAAKPVNRSVASDAVRGGKRQVIDASLGKPGPQTWTVPPVDVQFDRTEAAEPRITLADAGTISLADLLANRQPTARELARRRADEERRGREAAAQAAREEAARLAAEAEALAAKRKAGHERYLAERAYEKYVAERGEAPPAERVRGKRLKNETLTVDGAEIRVVRWHNPRSAWAEGLAPANGDRTPVAVAADPVAPVEAVPEKVDVSSFTYRKVVDTDGFLLLARVVGEGKDERVFVRTDTGWHCRYQTTATDPYPIVWGGGELFDALALKAAEGEKYVVIATNPTLTQAEAEQYQRITKQPWGKNGYRLSLERLWCFLFDEEPTTVEEATVPDTERDTDVSMLEA